MSRINRRDFVKLLGAGTASAAAGLWTPGCGSGSTSDGASDRVIVIGAGATGLVVGNAVTAAGREAVVLEARDRPGGRVWSRDVGGVPVDLGGMWISGPDGNPATCILNDEGIGWEPAEPIAVDIKAYDAVLQREIPLTELAGVAIALAEFDALLPALLETLGPRASMADAINRFLSESGLGEPARRYAEFGLRTQIESAYAQQSELIGLADYDFSNALAGGEHFPNGSYRGLIQALARGVDVRFDTVVSRIEHSSDGVTVETSRGTFRGGHVVVTVPLGVLKSGSIEFSPRLPAEKTAAIDRLAMAELEKVVLRYDDPFWQTPDSGNLLYVSEVQGEFPFIVDYTRNAGGEPTLVAFYCGNYGRSIASMSDDAIAGRAADIVEEIARTDGPTPTDVFVTRWKSDPYALGSYIYLPVGVGSSEIRALAAPVGDRLLFAGEATSSEYSGYVHGALLTGVREAERLLGTEGAELLSGLVIEQGCDEEA
jgi:polyamine oxidase